MEILIFVAAVALATFIGYKYYQAKKAAPDIYNIPETAEVKVVGNIATVAATEANIEAVKEEIKKAATKKAPTKKAVAKKDETKAAIKKAPAKKKPNLKVEK